MSEGTCSFFQLALRYSESNNLARGTNEAASWVQRKFLAVLWKSWALIRLREILKKASLCFTSLSVFKSKSNETNEIDPDLIQLVWFHFSNSGMALGMPRDPAELLAPQPKSGPNRFALSALIRHWRCLNVFYVKTVKSRHQNSLRFHQLVQRDG